MSQPPGQNKWICLDEKKLLESPVMEIIQRDCKSSEDDRVHRFYLLKSRDWCNIIPITEDGKVVMVRQYRIGISEHTLEVPGGVSDPEDHDLQAAAIRELTEETGYVPMPGARCVPIGWSHPNPAMINNRVHSFVIGPVRRDQTQNLDDGEMIDVVEVPLEEIADRILRGEITHALMLNTFFFLLLKDPKASALVAGCLRDFTTLQK